MPEDKPEYKASIEDEESDLFTDPEFQEALKDAETDEGIPWREAILLP